MGDGEMDEPESLGAISLAGARAAGQPGLRHQLQPAAPGRPGARQRQDHPGTRSVFRGAGWNVIKVIWGGGWDPLLAKDKSGLLLQAHGGMRRRRVPGLQGKGGAYVREHFFGKYPELQGMVADLSDDDIWRLNRGGHDPHKVYAAYAAAVKHTGQPTVILAKTVKGYGMGESGEGADDHPPGRRRWAGRLRKAFRDRFKIPVSDDRTWRRCPSQVARGQPGMKYLRERRGAGRLPAAAPPHLGVAGRCRRCRLRAPCSKAPASARSPPPWPSCACWARCCATRPSASVRRAHRARRVAHLRHGRHVPPARHLLLGRPALRAAGRRPADVLQGVQGRADPAGGHQRGGRHVVLDRRRHLATAPRRADDPVLHLLLDVRLAAHRRPGLGGGRPCARAASCSAAPPGAPRSTAKACSTRTATATSSPAPCPTASAYDPTFAYEVAVIVQDGLRRMSPSRRTCSTTSR
jgi:hypothetical protein